MPAHFVTAFAIDRNWLTGANSPEMAATLPPVYLQLQMSEVEQADRNFR